MQGVRIPWTSKLITVRLSPELYKAWRISLAMDNVSGQHVLESYIKTYSLERIEKTVSNISTSQQKD